MVLVVVVGAVGFFGLPFAGLRFAGAVVDVVVEVDVDVDVVVVVVVVVVVDVELVVVGGAPRAAD
jgi:hypothetical protein